MIVSNCYSPTEIIKGSILAIDTANEDIIRLDSRRVENQRLLDLSNDSLLLHLF